MAEGDKRVPAGWYPDPLGLPQLRWWDNQAWTEHTSEARQPMVAQETFVQQTRLSFADDEPVADALLDDNGWAAPDGSDGLPTTHAPTADTLLQLEAPARGTLVPVDAAASSAPEEKFAEFVATPASDTLAGRFDDLLVDDGRGGFPSIPASTPTAEPPAPAFDFAAHIGDLAPVAAGTATLERPVDSAEISRPADVPASTVAAPERTRIRRTTTAQAWIIAASPMTFVVVSLFLLTTGGMDVSGALVVTLSLALPYLGCIPLAAADGYVTRRRGLTPPHWLWIMGTPIVYLVARAVVLSRQTGRGFGPLLGIFAAGLANFAAILLVPGIVIGVNPLGFSHSIEASVEQQAAAFDVRLDVTCPPNPPTIVGDDFTCMAHERGDDSQGWDVRVSLARANGWISWRVEDWGELSSAHSGLRSEN